MKTRDNRIQELEQLVHGFEQQGARDAKLVNNIKEILPSLDKNIIDALLEGLENFGLSRKEEEQKNIARKLDELPPIWKGLALPLEDGHVILAESKFLNEYPDVSIEYIPFVKLDSPLSDSLKIIVETPARNRWTFKRSESVENFAEIYISEKGLCLRWDFDYIGGNFVETERVFNRILLSKLRITVANFSHDIVLWEPRASPNNLPNNLLGLLDLDDSDKLSARYAIAPSQLEYLPANLNTDINNKLQAIYLSHPETEDELLLIKTE